jgi:hypothetical protein
MPSIGENLDGEIGNALFLNRGRHRVCVQTNHKLLCPKFPDINSYATPSLALNL